MSSSLNLSCLLSIVILEYVAWCLKYILKKFLEVASVLFSLSPLSGISIYKWANMLDFYTRSQVSYMPFLIFSILCLTASIYRNTVLHRSLAFLHVIWSEPQADFCSILSFEGCLYGKQAWKMEAVSPLEQWIYILLSIMKDLGSLFRIPLW